MNKIEMYNFVDESNRIEGIIRRVTTQEEKEFERFMALKAITIEELNKFISVYQPNARLRNIQGLDVQVGNYIPPKGGPVIEHKLRELLENPFGYNAYEQHIAYETLHPFTDCNGRSGRALWAWRQRDLKLGFLHMFYYQTLQNSNDRK